MTDPGPDPRAAPDPVLQRRARVARWTAIGQRIGYGLFGVAVVAFFVGLAEGFPQDVIDLIVATMAIGSIVLAPSIVFAYAVKAADRDDREQGRPT